MKLPENLFNELINLNYVPFANKVDITSKQFK